MNEAILAASSFRNSRVGFDGEEVFLLCFFTIFEFLALAQDSCSAPDIPIISRVARGIGNKSEGSSYRIHGN
jgi:hypothetical protein